MNPALKGLIPVVLIVILLAIALIGAGVVVEAGHVGVLKTLGAVQAEPLREGFHLKKPFIDQVEQVDIRLTASNAQASAASRDLQTVSTQVTTQYSMNGEIAPLTYQRIGNLGKVSAALVEPAIQECVKSVNCLFRLLKTNGRPALENEDPFVLHLAGGEDWPPGVMRSIRNDRPGSPNRSPAWHRGEFEKGNRVRNLPSSCLPEDV